MSKNTIWPKKSELDQFYTNEAVAKFCYLRVLEIYKEDEFSLFLEPSAGTGSFFKLLPVEKRLGLDLEPKHNEIKKLDFFDYHPLDNAKTITIGNPPFGKCSSLAVKFFNKAAEFSNVIAFIVPKTFQKQSLQNKLNLNFILKLNIDLVNNSFIFNNKSFEIPCCFQIWERSINSRIINKIILDNNLFVFCKKEKANIAIRRIGRRAGKATSAINELSESSHYFLNYKFNNISINEFVSIINDINFSKIVNATSGIKSLSKPELITELRLSDKLKDFI